MGRNFFLARLEIASVCFRHASAAATRFVCLLLGLLAVTPAAYAQSDILLTFGAYASDKPSDMVLQLRPLLNAIEAQLSTLLEKSVKIRLNIRAGYEDATDMIVRGEVDMMRLGAASYVSAKAENASIGIIAMESIRGKKKFDGVIVVHQNSPIKTLEDLRGRSFAFGAETSTQGRFAPQLELALKRIYAKDFSRYEYLGRHDAVAAAVGAGLFDAGALEETMFNKMAGSGTPIRELHRYSDATKAWVVRADFDRVMLANLRAAVLFIKDKDALSALRFEGFLAGLDADYNDTRRAISENKMFFDPTAQKSELP